MATKLEQLQGAAQAALKASRDIAEKAENEGRDMTETERADFQKGFSTAEDLLEQIKTAKADQGLIARAKEMADLIGLPAGVQDDLSAQTKSRDPKAAERKLKSLGFEIVNSAQFKAATKAFTQPDGSVHVQEKSRFATDPIQVKSLFVGGDNTSAGVFVTPEQTGILEMLGRRPLTIRDLVSVRRTGSDTVEYVAQVSHTNRAAVVPEATSSAAPTHDTTTGAEVRNAGGGYKPEGDWAFERRTAVVKTIAEWVPATKRALADVAALEGLINDELRKDIAEAEEDQILLGDGTGENFTGILSTSGIQTQAFDTDIFVSTRRALTKARRIGRVVPNAIGLNPVDVETIDLARDGGATGGFMAGGPFALGARTLWGVPVFESESIPEGTGLLGDFSKAVLWDREQTTVTVTDSHADFFIRNMVAILAEERLAFAVTRPSAFVSVDVAA